MPRVAYPVGEARTPATSRMCASGRHRSVSNDLGAKLRGKTLELVHRSNLEVCLSETPPGITRRIPRHDMNVIMRNALSCGDTVVLKDIHASGSQPVYQTMCQTASLAVEVDNERLLRLEE